MNRNEWMTGGLLLLLAFAPRGAKSQVYQSYNSETSFFSEAPLENITAINKDGASVINGESGRSEEHTSELQSRENLVCRLLLEKKKSLNNEVAVSHIQQHRLILER